MSSKNISDTWVPIYRRQLLTAIDSCKDTEELGCFLRDILTLEEIDEISRRLEAARLLHAKVPYSQVQEATGFSTTTIARVSQWLKNGANGYPRVLKRLAQRNRP